jgi:glycosyltransferase involved in cell wall biosynthesis
MGTVSLCMIARNEANNLVRCLTSVREVVAC